MYIWKLGLLQYMYIYYASAAIPPDFIYITDFRVKFRIAWV